MIFIHNISYFQLKYRNKLAGQQLKIYRQDCITAQRGCLKIRNMPLKAI